MSAASRRAAAAVVLALGVWATAAAGDQQPSDAPAADALDRRHATIPRAEPVDTFASLSGALRSGFQWLARSDTARGAVLGLGSLDVNLVLRPADNARVFVDVEGLAGAGADQKLGSLSRLHFDAERLEGRDTHVILKELWLRLAFLDERLRFSLGKLDPGHYFDRNFFAEDDSTQFLDAALLNNPVLKPPPNGPGAAVRASAGDWRYALGVHAPGDVDGDLSGLPFVIGELGRRKIFALQGHYRLWARVGSVPDAREHVTWASGVSIDQLVTRDIGVFVRAGLGRSEGEPLTSRAGSGGVQVTPTWLDRGKDRAGIGYSYQREPDGRETLVETYYTLALLERLSVTANVQWLVSGPNRVTERANRHAVVPGLRALLLF